MTSIVTTLILLVGAGGRGQHNTLGLPLPPESPGGTLMICGGGHSLEAVHKEFIRLAGGPKARIVLIPSAKTFESRQAMEKVYAAWRSYRVASFAFLDARNREESNSPAVAGLLKGATGVWMAGGAQSRLADLYDGTKVEDGIREVFQRGGVVAGTSAGAAFMSRVMIRYGRPPQTSVGRGLGLIDKAVVDQHFTQRHREARLLDVLAKNQGLLGLGVDEGTALLVHGNHLQVLGSAGVEIVLPKQGTSKPAIYHLKGGQQRDFPLE
jgi:cyanophycinase